MITISRRSDGGRDMLMQFGSLIDAGPDRTEVPAAWLDAATLVARWVEGQQPQLLREQRRRPGGPARRLARRRGLRRRHAAGGAMEPLTLAGQSVVCVVVSLRVP